MKTSPVIFVHIYLSEASDLQDDILHYLKNDANIAGASVYRAISGFGSSGVHTASFLDLSLDLPLIIEFFDEKNKVMPAISYLNNLVKPKHILFWEANNVL